jgi:hypothetical protein
MPPTPPRVTVRTAERPGRPDKPSEDRIFTTDNAVIVLDGASQPEQTERNGGWLAEQLGSVLAGRLRANPTEDLAEALAWSIATVADAHGLVPGDSPSTTVAILRWSSETLDALVLCDSPIVVVTRDDRVELIEDTRLAGVTARLKLSSRLISDDPKGWSKLVAGQRQQRNHPGGYWVAEATPAAAHHAVRATWPTEHVLAVVAMTDGVSIGVEHYGHPPDWKTAAALAAQDPHLLVDAIHLAEASDPDCKRWHRSKVHDDKAVAAAVFS